MTPPATRLRSTRLRTFLAAALCVLGLAAPSIQAASPAEEQVMAVTQAACDAFRTRDLPTLEQLLAPEFTLVGTDATIQPRTQAIAEVRAGEPHYDVFQNHDLTAHVSGDAAVVQGITTLRGTSAGKPFAVDVRFTDTLIRTEGRWRVVVSHATRIPARE